ncbi:hypothetical protein lerEdw1_016387 [Lerista edwardsae]|nr:hypothetical protein lerEdw1_016387 [Lerista edwardsae]
MRNSIGEGSETYTVSCRKEDSCPSAEEYQPITIILEVVDWLVYVYEEHNSSFFIKDIITPDASECQVAKHGHRATLTWRHPDTWTTPESYFGLTYQIETSGRKTPSICEVDNTALLRNGSTLSCYIQTRGDKFRIRSRDRYRTSDSAWSSWSEPCRYDQMSHLFW